MQAELTAFYRGEISFTQFARLTNSSWRALATTLLRKWQAPGVSVEDLQQELLFACSVMIPRFDAARGVSLQKFIVYNTCDKAKKWLHRQRNAYRRDDNSPGRFPISWSSLGLEEHQEEWILGNVAVEASQEERLIERELQIERQQVIASIPTDDLAFMYYQQAGSVDEAAAAIHANPRASLALRAVTLDDAREQVERSIERAAEAANVAA